MTPHLVAWRINNQRWSLWHISTDPGFTICGQHVPAETPYSKPATAPYGDGRGKNKLAGACRTCRMRFAFHKESV